MLSPMFNIILIPLLIAMFLAVNMGGSGTALAFSAAYGANLIRKDINFIGTAEYRGDTCFIIYHNC